MKLGRVKKLGVDCPLVTRQVRLQAAFPFVHRPAKEIEDLLE